MFFELKGTTLELLWKQTIVIKNPTHAILPKLWACCSIVLDVTLMVMWLVIMT